MQTAIQAGADVLSVHGRTRHQSSEGHPVNLLAIKFAVEAAKGQVPVVANGDVFSLAEAKLAREECGVNGVMSARGLLANPVCSVSNAGSRLTCLVGIVFWLREYTYFRC